jgi:hypothetical protein
MTDNDHDDVVARSIAENAINDLMNHDHDLDDECHHQARDILSAFPSVRFEQTLFPVGDDDVWRRRLVITGPWKVDPTHH